MGGLDSVSPNEKAAQVMCGWRAAPIFGISRGGVAGRGGQRGRGCSGDAGKRWATAENREKEHCHGNVTP